MKRYITAAVLITILVGVVLMERFSKVPETLSPDTLSAQLLEQGFYEATGYTFSLVDKQRVQSVNKGQTKEARKVQGSLWYPVIEQDLVAPGKHPLVIFYLHYRGKESSVADTAELLASKGYLVAVLRPNSSGGRSSLVNNLSGQPDAARDISFLLDTLTDWNKSPDTPFYSRIDFDRVAVTGYSTGSITAQLASFHPTLSDERIDLAVFVAPIGSLFTPAFFETRQDLPILTIASHSDVVTPYENNALKITENHTQSTLINIKNGSHAGFAGYGRYLRWFSNPDLINCHRIAAAIKHSNQSEILQELISLAPEVISTEEGQTCSEREAPAINTLKQYQLGVLSLQSFLESHFADTEFERNAAKNYLHQTMAVENENISIFLPSDINSEQ